MTFSGRRVRPEEGKGEERGEEGKGRVGWVRDLEGIPANGSGVISPVLWVWVDVFRRREGEGRWRLWSFFGLLVEVFAGKLCEAGGDGEGGPTGGVSPGKTRAWWLGSGRLERKREGKREVVVG
ncbi:hypothetical protein HAX54_049704, partial [Datura stramonium]|nr:hypothetical protein [Datura stramonium]